MENRCRFFPASIAGWRPYFLFGMGVDGCVGVLGLEIEVVEEAFDGIVGVSIPFFSPVWAIQLCPGLFGPQEAFPRVGV